MMLVEPVHSWYCPRCRAEDVTRGAVRGTRMHTCPALRGLSTPMLPAGTSAKVELTEWEDYEGSERVQRGDDGRPVSSVTVTRDDGQDCVVYAPTASVTTGA